MTTTTDPGTKAGIEAGALYRLLAWLSPGFPTGAFSYSHGLEAAVERGAVHDRMTLQAWIAAIVIQGSGRTDADILRDAYNARDRVSLAEVNTRGLAFRATGELAVESSQQGAAFFSTCEAAWSIENNPSPALRERVDRRVSGETGEGGWAGDGACGRPLTPALFPGGGEGVSVCHAATFGATAAKVGIALDDALLGYLQAFAANLMSAGLRLGVIGQTDGQRILAALEPAIVAAAQAAPAREPADFGSATFAVDIASMAHETQYSRLFRS